jgi:hypothetical protein
MRVLVILFAISLMSSCTEYDLSDVENPTPPADDDDDDTVPPDDDDSAGPDEECDGIDNDGDGQVDEGYMDADHDGIADCVDDDCDVFFPPEETIPIIEECEGSGVVVVNDPWNVAVEWTWDSGGQGVIVMPAVGNLTDDNGDGAVDELDMPDIAFTVWGDNRLVALHGDGSGVIFDIPGYDGQAGVSIADVDVDGVPEIVASTSDHRVAAVDGTGTPEWVSQPFSWSMYPQPAVADLEGDGDVEIVFDIALVEGANGATISMLNGVTTSWRTPVIADLDVDGTSEIIVGEKVFAHTGAVEWSTSSAGSGNFAAVADIDGDSGGEVLFVTGSALVIHDHDGSQINTLSIPGSNPGPPAVADFDGDGEVEIAIAANSAISVWEVTGTPLWSSPISDSSGLAGCSGYDVDGDGIYEVLYADEEVFRIFDGATGTIRFVDGTHDSGTLWEYPVTADVDNDGSAEIVVASNMGTFNGIAVFGHNGGGWAKSGPTWGTHDFAVTNLGPDGSVPGPTPTSWSVHNVFRARPVMDNPGVPDLIPVFGEYCVASCTDGPVKISYNIANQGGTQVNAPVPVSLFTVDQGGETLIDTQFHWPLPPGQSVYGNIFVLHPDQWGGGFIIRVDDNGFGAEAVEECDETNNEYAYYETLCY